MDTPTLKSFVEALQALPTFDPTTNANKLQQASRSTAAMSAFDPSFPNPYPDQKDTIFDGQDCASHIDHLAAAAAARGMAATNDDFGFHQIVNLPNALDLSKRTVATLMPYLWGQHVNENLKAANIANLQELMENAQFVESFQDELANPTFEHLALMHDDAANNRDYTTNLLFVNEYFKHGPGYDMSRDVPSQVQDPTHWTVLVSGWIKTCLTPDFIRQYPEVQATRFIPCTSIVYALDGYPDSASETLLAALKQSLPDLADWDTGDDIRYYTSVGQIIWASWDNSLSNYQNAVSRAESLTNTTTVPPVIVGRFPPVTTTTKTSYGDAAAAFVSQYRSLGLFNGDPTNRTRYQTHYPFEGSCFSPGTKILTREGGNLQIENLTAGTEILTQGGKNPQFGAVSDEQVVHSAVRSSKDGIERMSLWGFNGLKPFFTADHVFHTTTGLRAINPQAAKAENPWADIGRLQVGHVLLHTDDGETYKPVPITCLHFNEANCDKVYGIHLRSGLRSYHANGYLVHLNYPEITIKSIAKLLLPLGHIERLRLLESFKELRPLFLQFGATTLMDALQRQLTTPEGRPKHLLGQEKTAVLKTGAQHITRTWHLSDDQRSIKSPQLPSISVSQGVVKVNGKYISQASVSEHRILWSRPLRGDDWEHGYLNFRSDLLTASGAIVYAPNNVTPDVSKVENIRKVNAAVKDRSSEIDKKLFNVAQTTTEASITPSPVYPRIDTYSLSYDTAPWVEGNTVPTNKVPYLYIYETMVGDLREYSCRIPILDQIRDKISDQLQTENSIQLATVPDLYNCWTSLDANQNTIIYFQMTQPELIAQAADGFEEDQAKSYTNLTFTNLGLDVSLPFIFDQMRLVMGWDGSDLTGIIRAYDPTMVGQMGQRILVTGEYVNASQTFQRQANALSALAGKSMSSTSQLIAAHTAPPKFLKALATSTQAVPTDNKTGAQELANLPLDAKTVHESTQSLLYRTMLFHMAQSDLDNFTGDTRPVEGTSTDQVPANLGSNLDTEIVSWIQSTYIPMWIAKRIISTNDATQSGWREKFSSSEKKKIDYFWTGKGKTCLSQCGEYNLLNQLCATAALRTVSPRLAQYADDPAIDHSTGSTKGMSGGTRWATVLYNSQAFGPAFNQLCLKYNTDYDNGYNKAQKVCNIFQVLNPLPTQVPQGGWTSSNKPFAMKLMDKINTNAKTYGIVFTAVPFTNDEELELEYQWMYNAMQQLWQALLNGDPGYGDEVGQKLREDANNLAEALGLDAQQSAKWKAEQMAILTARIIRESVLFTRVAKDTGFTQKIINGTKGISRAFLGAEKAIKENTDPRLSSAAGFMHLSMAIGTVASFLGSAWSSFRDFKSLSTEDQAKLCLASIQTGLVMLSQAKDAWKAFSEAKTAREKSLAAASIEQNDLGEAEEERKERFPGEDSEDASDIIYGSDDPEKASPAALEVDADTASALKASSEEIKSEGPLPEDIQEEKIPESRPPAPDEPPGLGKKLKDNFSIGAHGIRAALFVVGVAMTVVACVGLAASWDKLDVVSKWLDTLSVVQQGLSSIVEGVSLVLDIAEITEGVIATVCAWAGPILAIIGLVLMIAMLIWQSKQPPPLTPVETWIKDNGHKALDPLLDPPPPLLQWSVSTPLPAGAANTTLTITGTNTTAGDVVLYSVTSSFFSGSTDSALFANSTFSIKPDISPLSDGHVGFLTNPNDSVKHASFSVAAAGTQTGTDKKTQTQYNFGVLATGQDPDILTIPSQASLVISAIGTVGPKGTYKLTVTETHVDDKKQAWDSTNLPFTIEKT